MRLLLFQFLETVGSEEAEELKQDDFTGVVSAIVSAYDSGDMPKPGTEDFTAAFKKWIKVGGREWRLLRLIISTIRTPRLYAPRRVLITCRRWSVPFVALSLCQPRNALALSSCLKATGKKLERKGKRLFHPIRLALTGSMSGPDIGEQLDLLHRGEEFVRAPCPRHKCHEILYLVHITGSVWSKQHEIQMSRLPAATLCQPTLMPMLGVCASISAVGDSSRET